MVDMGAMQQISLVSTLQGAPLGRETFATWTFVNAEILDSVDGIVESLKAALRAKRDEEAVNEGIDVARAVWSEQWFRGDSHPTRAFIENNPRIPLDWS